MATPPLVRGIPQSAAAPVVRGSPGFVAGLIEHPGARLRDLWRHGFVGHHDLHGSGQGNEVHLRYVAAQVLRCDTWETRGHTATAEFRRRMNATVLTSPVGLPTPRCMRVVGPHHFGTLHLADEGKGSRFPAETQAGRFEKLFPAGQ